MRNLLIITSLFVSLFSYSQSGMYIITEKYDGIMAPFYPSLDSVYVTNPSGITTGYSITHFILNTGAHDSELNNILNPIINQGYILTNFYGAQHNNTLLPNQLVNYNISYYAQP